jgi:ribonuclease-3 family protein
MEKSIKAEDIRALFALEPEDIRSYSPLTLAYVGDAVYELVIRTMIISKGNAPVNKLHKRSAALVKAPAQAQMMKVIEPLLSEEELHIYKRGRNAKSYTSAKNASVIDYRIATGFEALMGWFYLQERQERMLELIKIGLNELPQ